MVVLKASWCGIRYVRHPDSSFSGWWDMLQIVALLYVSGFVPFRVSMGRLRRGHSVIIPP
jgi:hypothetical protein